MKGKNFSNRKPKEQRPDNDFYETPICMTEELVNTGVLDGIKNIKDPCCGKYAITKTLEKHGFTCKATDLVYGQNYLDDNIEKCECIVMNPPFSAFDKFCEKAKKEADLICVIGKITFFGAHNRNINGLWNHLRDVYIFDRQIAYDKPLRADGKVECGMLVSGWFIWDMNYQGKPQIQMLDMQKYILQKGKKNG